MIEQSKNQYDQVCRSEAHSMVSRGFHIGLRVDAQRKQSSIEFVQQERIDGYREACLEASSPKESPSPYRCWPIHLAAGHRVFPGKIWTFGERHREYKKEYEHTRPTSTCIALILKGRLGLQNEAHPAFGDQISSKGHGVGCILLLAPHVNRNL